MLKPITQIQLSAILELHNDGIALSTICERYPQFSTEQLLHIIFWINVAENTTKEN